MQIDEVLPPHIYDFLQVRADNWNMFNSQTSPSYRVKSNKVSWTVQSALVVIGSAVVAVVIDPWVVLALVPLVVVIVAVRQYYMGAARDLRRLLAIS